MKKLILLITILITSCNQPKPKSSFNTPVHKYRVEFSDGKDWDYTNEITHTSENCIQYCSRGEEITRCGTYSIIKLK